MFMSLLWIRVLKPLFSETVYAICYQHQKIFLQGPPTREIIIEKLIH